MKVSEFINELSKLDPDALVIDANSFTMKEYSPKNMMVCTMVRHGDSFYFKDLLVEPLEGTEHQVVIL